MKKYVIYQRVSTEEQKQKGYSLEAMHEKCMYYIKAQDGAVLIKTYEDAGFSGTLPPMKRPGMKQMLDDIKVDRSMFDTILVWKLDRLSRSLRDTLNLEFTFSKFDKSLESVTERLDTSTAAGRVFFNTIASFAEFESAQTRERTYNAMSSKVGQKHLGGVAPIGYKLENGKYEIIPTEALVVRQIFKVFLARGTFSTAAKEMNANNLYTKNKKSWSHTRIKEVLINPIYIGLTAWHKTSRLRGRLSKNHWIFAKDKTHGAIIDDVLFNKVQKLIGKKLAKQS